MLRTTIRPARSFQFRPAFWGVDRDLKDVLEVMENAWETGGVKALSEFKETDQAFLMSIDMPGVSKKDLNLQIENDIIYITATRKVFFDKEESSKQTLSRTIQVPKLVDVDKIKAHIEDGVLYLALPKLEKAKAKKIEISETEDFSKLIES